MTVPQLALLVFALWTITVPLGAVGYYRWSRILTGVSAVNEFRSDRVEGADWYRRAMRAHANCVENLPVLGAIVFLLTILHLDTPLLDGLSIVIVMGRAIQSTVHIGWTQTQLVASLRFAAYILQVGCMYALALSALLSA